MGDLKNSPAAPDRA